MEKCFGYFGLKAEAGISSTLGLNDERVQLQEIEDIETTMPDAKIVMIQPQPIDMRTLRGALSQSRDTAFDLITQVAIGDPDGGNNNNMRSLTVTYHIVLPPFYPTLEAPDISISCAQMPHKSLHILNTKLDKYIHDNAGSQRFILESVDWVEERIKRVLESTSSEYDELDSEMALR